MAKQYSPGPVPKEALSYFRAKGLKVGFDHRDVWREEHATAFTVAKAMKVDVLESIRDALDQSLAEGQTFHQFKRELVPTLQKLGWWGRQDMTDPVTGETREVQLGSPRRLKTIYRTNLRTARAAGQWQRIERNRNSHPYLVYLLGPSKEHREQHEAWANKVLPVDDPFWATHMPPNGWGCKCHVRAMTRRQAERRGISEPPAEEKKEWVNQRTGEVSQVPAGIDPGFDTNPGRVARTEHAARVFGTKLMAADADIGSVALSASADFVRQGMARNYQAWAAPLYRRERQGGGDMQLVSVIAPRHVAALRKHQVDLQTAAITLRDIQLRHFARHSKRDRGQVLPEDTVLNLPEHLAAPQAILLDRADGNLVWVFPLADNRLAKIVIQPGRKDKARLSGARASVRTNEIRTATVVDRSALPASRYRLIDGEI